MPKHEDELTIQRMLSVVDEKTIQKTRDFAKLMSYYKCAMMTLQTRFTLLGEQYLLEQDRNPINSIQTRLKSPPSILEKLQRQNLPISVASVEGALNDIAGVRVICSFPDDVYALADSLLKQDDITLLQKKDYIAHPKENGYRSLHLIVSMPVFLSDEKKLIKAEIQLRTIAMDFWASLEHQLRYKKDSAFTDEMAAELYACAQVSAELDLRMDALRRNVLRSRCG